MKMSNYKAMVGAVARLHNFCINERLQAGMPATAYNESDLAFEDIVSMLREQAAKQDYQEQ